MVEILTYIVLLAQPLFLSEIAELTQLRFNEQQGMDFVSNLSMLPIIFFTDMIVRQIFCLSPTELKVGSLMHEIRRINQKKEQKQKRLCLINLFYEKKNILLYRKFKGNILGQSKLEFYLDN